MSATARLFVALQPPPVLARELHARAAELLAPCAAALRFYAADELHLTLVFLGATPRERVGEIAAALRTHAPPIELEIAGAGAFPSLSRPRVVWAGARELPGSEGRLEELVRGLRPALGMPPEPGPFRAHLTLARPRQGARLRLPEELAGLALPGVWRCEPPALFESRPEERPRYRRLS